ncbi:MAG: (2Fe-2S)-binding protein [Candidatus Bipolaricaulota bacterium]|nr:(2Fe-2S)-binding protein [Candidatus Bipolaricaulota bacterium]MDW8126572.1 (2Fe-2S)-binding protein [Candidatus Bipolaricaulota bacterium]
MRLIQEDPRWGRVVYFCNAVTEARFVEVIRRGARTLDGTKFRTRASFGRCQGSFCATKLLEILARELKRPMWAITTRGARTFGLERKSSPMRIKADVAVVGGGAAGMAAAKAAAATGAKTLLIERERKLGGVLDQCIHTGFGLHRYHEELTGPEFAHRISHELEATGAEILTEATVLNISEPLELRVASLRGLFKVMASAVV